MILVGSENNSPLTIEQLMNMVGKPVFVVTKERAEWCLLHSFDKDEAAWRSFIVTRRTAEKKSLLFRECGKEWKAYVSPPVVVMA